MFIMIENVIKSIFNLIYKQKCEYIFFFKFCDEYDKNV